MPTVAWTRDQDQRLGLNAAAVLAAPAVRRGRTRPRRSLAPSDGRRPQIAGPNRLICADQTRSRSDRKNTDHSVPRARFAGAVYRTCRMACVATVNGDTPDDMFIRRSQAEVGAECAPGVEARSPSM
jgi:hypothetical protein